LKRIGIINYGIGNLGSVQSALHQIQEDSFLIESVEDFHKATHIILPGVGAFGIGMQNLKERQFDRAIRDAVAANKPLLGICLGMQLLASRGTEFGDTDGLNLIPGKVIQLQVDDLRLPHVGWNDLTIKKEDPVFTSDLHKQAFYFVHSFHFVVDDKTDIAATTTYGEDFVSCVSRGRVFGAQFHPEKSQKFGLQMLKNFCGLTTLC